MTGPDQITRPIESSAMRNYDEVRATGWVSSESSSSSQSPIASTALQEPSTLLSSTTAADNHALQLPQPQPNTMYRKNFGKTGIYVPPNKRSFASHASPTGAVQTTSRGRSNRNMIVDEFEVEEEEEENDVITREDLHSVSDDEEEADNVIVPSPASLKTHPEAPTPLTKDRRVMSLESRPFDERRDYGPAGAMNEEDMEPPSLCTKAGTTGSAMPTSPRATAASVATTSPRSADQFSPRQNRAIDSIDALSARDRFNMPPPRLSSPATNLLAQHAVSLSRNSPRHANTKESAKARVAAAHVQEPPDEDDSLFDFRESHERRNRSGSRAQEPLRKSPTTLSERTRDAWERKNQRKSVAVTRESSPLSARSASVSFDKQKDTIQYYEPDDAHDDTTLADRSLNSEYTKSAESEVEDLIKDIFMLGSGTSTKPGRRKVRYSSSVKDRSRCSKVQTEDDETYATYDDSELLKKSRRKSRQSHSSTDKSGRDKHDGKNDVDDDPLSEIWNFMEGGIKSVGEALGLASNEENKYIDNVREVNANTNAYDSDPSYDNNERTQALWLKILGTTQACTGKGNFTAIEAVEEPMALTSIEDEIPHALSLEEDMRLVDLASQAARSMHRLRGMDFDEAYEINIATDIRFAVVELNMPFGLIFQENPTGVWITKVLPDGNAAKTREVQLGDQLAAIDGMSAINMKVDEISALIRKKRGIVELTFLRFVGPLRPAAGIEEEGYEVKPSAEAYRSITSRSSSPAQAPFIGSAQPPAMMSPKVGPTSGKRRFRLFGFGGRR